MEEFVEEELDAIGVHQPKNAQKLNFQHNARIAQHSPIPMNVRIFQDVHGAI